MDNRSNYSDDLAGIKGMPVHPKDNPFIVPANYFNALEDKIMQRVVAITDAEKSFSVPESYFDGLTKKILERIHQEEQESTSIFSLSDDEQNPFLEKLREIVPNAGYTVPDNYFEELNTKLKHTIPSDTAEHEELEKVIPFRKKKSKFTSWIGYVAAACIAISLGTYTFLQLNAANSFEKKLEHISNSDIVSYLEYYSEPGDGAIFEAQFEGVQQIDKSNFSEEDIEAYLDYSI